MFCSEFLPHTDVRDSGGNSCRDFVDCSQIKEFLSVDKPTEYDQLKFQFHQLSAKLQRRDSGNFRNVSSAPEMQEKSCTRIDRAD